MRKFLIVGLILVISIFGVYFFTRDKTPNDLVVKKTKIKNNLTAAQQKLNKERQTLDSMMGNLQGSFLLIADVQDQMNKISDMVRQTNFMFSDPNGDNPQLIAKNIPNASVINGERREINLIMIEWQKKIELFANKKLSVSELNQIKKDASTIKVFLEDIAKIVKLLTPDNSGLSQIKIDTFGARISSNEAVDKVFTSFKTAVDNYSEDNSKNLNNTSASDPSSLFQNNSVTFEDFLAQKKIVDDIQSEVNSLEEQLVQVEEQIQQASPSPNNNSDSSDSSSIDPILPDNSTVIDNSSDQTVNTDPGTTIDPLLPTNPDPSTIPDTITPDPVAPNPTTDVDDNIVDPNNANFKGIIVQPGPPRLIQGTNQF